MKSFLSFGGYMDQYTTIYMTFYDEFLMTPELFVIK